MQIIGNASRRNALPTKEWYIGMKLLTRKGHVLLLRLYRSLSASVADTSTGRKIFEEQEGVPTPLVANAAAFRTILPRGHTTQYGCALAVM